MLSISQNQLVFIEFKDTSVQNTTVKFLNHK